jgi:hypothetical protein
MVAYAILSTDLTISDETENGVRDVVKSHADGFIKSFAGSEYAEELDFSEESVGILDEIIEDSWGDEGPSKQNKVLVVKAFGGYLATIIQNSFRGKWWHDGKEPVFVLFDGSKPSGIGLTPYSYVVRRFDEGEELSEQWGDMEPLVSERRIHK